MKFLKTMGVGLFCAALAACGGGGSNSSTLTGNPSTGGTTGPSASSVAVSTSATQIAADGSSSATITAVVRDANQNFVKDATVTFSANAGGLAVANAGKTDQNGAVTATLVAQGAAAGTNITVTAAVGTVSGTTTVSVVAAQQTLSLSTDSAQIPSDATKAATITALLRDASNNVIANAPVTFVSSSGVLVVTKGTTDATGRATATLDAGSDPSNRRITVTARAGTAAQATIPVDVTGTSLSITGPANLVQGTQATYTILLTNSANKGIANTAVALTSAAGNTLSSTSVTTDANGQATVKLTGAVAGNDTLAASALGLIAQQPVAVSNQNFAFNSPTANQTVNLGQTVPVAVTWKTGATPQVGQTITFSTTRGTLTSTTATTDANGQATVNLSSTTAGPAVIQAAGTGVSAQVGITFVATTPTQVNVQASPSSIQVQGQSTITAVVRDAQNNLVANQTVTFNLTDPTGGTLSTSTAVTDSQGRALTTYTASTTTSAANGVKIDATVAGTAVTGSTTLTVGGRTVFLSLGTGNLINDESPAQYSVDYAIQAVDAQGNALSNANIALKIVSIEYVKGNRVWSDPATFWVTVRSTPANCASEDVNFNGILDAGEDFNNNGKLEPGNVAFVSPGTGTTNAAGTLLTKVIYPKEFAYYVKVTLTATASVQGTESSTSTTFLLPGATKDFNVKTTAPPGPISRFGTATSCSDPN